MSVHGNKREQSNSSVSSWKEVVSVRLKGMLYSYARNSFVLYTRYPRECTVWTYQSLLRLDVSAALGHTCMGAGIRTENHPPNSNELPCIYQSGSVDMDDYNPTGHTAAKQSYSTNHDQRRVLVGSQKPMSTWIGSLIGHEPDWAVVAS